MRAKPGSVKAKSNRQFARIVGHVGAIYRSYPGCGLARIVGQDDTDEEDELSGADVFTIYSYLKSSLEPGQVVEFEKVIGLPFAKSIVH